MLKKFETTMMAVAFAEEGELETARQILREEERSDEAIFAINRDSSSRTIEGIHAVSMQRLRKQ